ncbi:unnamed protein product [Blepharisma stoltei]|uniref:Uncharacterized protein n=1 Tax=Blepharisma stoltei TaxID=1481888 RepID=A0AAU9IHG4_9CILI|nr:unnamed protein product [Blepharisma stoltei]
MSIFSEMIWKKGSRLDNKSQPLQWISPIRGKRLGLFIRWIIRWWKVIFWKWCYLAIVAEPRFQTGLRITELEATYIACATTECLKTCTEYSLWERYS